MEVCSIRGSHPVIRSILSAAEQIAATDVCALIIGEKGTGKELLARHIHAVSRRGSGPFVRVDCQDLVLVRGGRELRGAPDAIAPGGTVAALFERARGGTLFFDQLTALGSAQQARLLATPPDCAVDVRLLAALDPLESGASCLAATGLPVVEIPVPALRQRRSDVPVLVEHFLELYARRHSVGIRRVETEAMVLLWQYDWPGNVRELESVIERVVVLSRSGVIRPADLPPHISRMKNKPNAGPRGNGHAPFASRHA
jgi:DNA-binding NtrC family response regulator